MNEQPIKVLLVEDDEFDKVSVTMKLLRREFQIQVARTPHAAIQLIQTFEPEVVLLDYFLEGTTAVAVLEYLAKLPDSQRPNVIGYSADETNFNEHLSQLDENLQKPFTLGADEFRGLLTQHGSEARLRMENARQGKITHLVYQLQSGGKLVAVQWHGILVRDNLGEFNSQFASQIMSPDYLYLDLSGLDKHFNLSEFHLERMLGPLLFPNTVILQTGKDQGDLITRNWLTIFRQIGYKTILAQHLLDGTAGEVADGIDSEVISLIDGLSFSS